MTAKYILFENVCFCAYSQVFHTISHLFASTSFSQVIHVFAFLAAADIDSYDFLSTNGKICVDLFIKAHLGKFKME